MKDICSTWLMNEWKYIVTCYSVWKYPSAWSLKMYINILMIFAAYFEAFTIWTIMVEELKPGQYGSSHSILSFFIPVQSIPPYWGIGLLHDLDLILTPSLQVTEHAPKPLQHPHPPSTKINDIDQLLCWTWHPASPARPASMYHSNKQEQIPS